MNFMRISFSILGSPLSLQQFKPSEICDVHLERVNILIVGLLTRDERERKNGIVRDEHNRDARYVR